MNRHTHINDNDDCYQNQAKEVTDLQQVGLTNTSAFTSFSHVQWWVIYFLRKMVKWTRGTYFSAPDELHPCHALRWMHPWQMLPEQAIKNQNYPAIIWYLDIWIQCMLHWTVWMVLVMWDGSCSKGLIFSSTPDLQEPPRPFWKIQLQQLQRPGHQKSVEMTPGSLIVQIHMIHRGESRWRNSRKVA